MRCTNCLQEYTHCVCVARGRMSEWGKHPAEYEGQFKVPNKAKEYWNYEGVDSENESLTSSEL